MKSQMLTNTNKSKSFLIEFTFGGLAALISKTVASPIQVIKLRLQVQYALIEKGLITHPYQGIIDCFQRLYIENGILAYFKGNGTNALRFFLTHSLNFSFRDFFRNVYSQYSGINKQKLSFWANLGAGGLAGASTQLVVYPLDYARTRLSNQVGKNTSDSFNGLADCLLKTYKNDGILGLYRGFTVSCLCMIIYRGLNFGIYDSLRPFLPREKQQNMIYTFTLGYFATILAGAFSYPLDTIRRRLMMTSGSKQKFAKNSDCIKKIKSEGGYKAFFRGTVANILGGITGAVVFSVYDKMKVEYIKNYMNY